MAKYDNIDETGKNAFERVPTYDDIIRQKGKDTKKALHKQKKEDDTEARGKAMDEEIAKEAEAKQTVEKQALENNGSNVETRDKNKDIETGNEPTEVIEDIKTQTPKKTTVETETIEQTPVEQPTEEKSSEDEMPPENVQEELDQSDEAKAAKEAVEEKDPTALQNIVTPEGEAVLKGSYDENSLYVPHVYTIEDSRLVKNKGLAACLTIISQAISAFGAAAGIPIKPINFMKFGATPEEDLERLNKNEENYATVLNGTKTPGLTTKNQREAEREAALEDIEEFKNVSDEDAQKAAQIKASMEGQNTQLDVQREAQEFDKWKTEYAGDLQKTMQAIQNQFQLDLTDKLYRQQVQAIVDKITYMKESGFSNDDIAKAIQSMGGVTQLQRGLGYAKDITGMVSEIGNTAGSIIHGKASNTRANAAAQNANTSMLRENRLGVTWE